MTTESQKRASRENGAKSRGPKSAAGKLRSSLNGFRLGSIAKSLLTDLEDKNDFAALHARIADAFHPEDAVSRLFVENMAVARWQALRASAMQTAALQKETNSQIDAGRLDPEKDPDLTPESCLSQAFHALSAQNTPGVYNLSRDKARYEREFARNVTLLMKWRAEKRAEKRAAQQQTKEAE